MATLLRVNGTRENIPGPLSLEQMQAAVGGYIEMVRLGGTDARMHVLFVNEDGHALGLVPNAQATALLRTVRPGGLIVGNALECVVLNAGTDDERTE